jgi:hypothetical protein
MGPFLDEMNVARRGGVESTHAHELGTVPFSG